MSSSRYVGRHASARRARVLRPATGGGGVARTAAKSVAGVGIVLGSGAFVIAPTSATGASEDGGRSLTSEQAVGSDLIAERAAMSPGSSRSSQRGAAAAVTAPSSTGAERADLGEVGVEAVAAPEPEPRPEPEPKQQETPVQDRAEEDAEAPGTPREPESGTTESASSEDDSASSDSRSAPSPDPEATPDADPETGNHAAEAAALGLGPNAQKVYSAVRTQFPDMSDIGGYRAGDGGDHGSGRAVDIMVSGARGDQVAAWVQQNAGSLGVKYVIWKQRIWTPGGSWEPMEDRGDPTQNHFDHVHVSVS